MLHLNERLNRYSHFGDLMLLRGVFSDSEYLEVREEVERKPHLDLEAQLVARGLVQARDYEDYLLMLDASLVLVHQGVLSLDQLEAALTEQAKSGLNLGHILTCRLESCPVEPFLAALTDLRRQAAA